MYGANLRANGIRQHYLRYGGSGVPIILVPGITSPAITWGFIAERLAERYDVYVLDVRGRGLSQADPGLGYSLDACANDVTGFVRALGIDDYHLVGHSMGARIAIRAARHDLAGIQKMVWVDPPVTGPGRRPYPAPLSWYVDSIRLATQGASWQEMKTFLPSWTEEQLKLRAEWLHTCLESAIVASYDGFHADDIHQDVSDIRVPTLLMAAERGDVIRDEEMAELMALKPDLEAVRVPNAGHMIPWDNLDGFVAGINRFLG
ncbi:alpha/beta fold hydrolase [Ferrovibrio xuzhouensis]|uniref:Alpha/beta fold hydrolase n=1 Tax=Ferrovibrio xuzhouensis TaxID=1576914 RepID=A0ABV7VKG4_9PROT